MNDKSVNNCYRVAVSVDKKLQVFEVVASCSYLAFAKALEFMFGTDRNKELPAIMIKIRKVEK